MVTGGQGDGAGGAGGRGGPQPKRWKIYSKAPFLTLKIFFFFAKETYIFLTM